MNCRLRFASTCTKRSAGAGKKSTDMKTIIEPGKLPFVLAILVLLSGCHKKGDTVASERLPMATVRVTTVADKKYMATEEAVGTVRAKLRAAIEAKVSGRIEKMPVVVGQMVKKGDLLVLLDVREIHAKLDQAKAVRVQTERDRKRFEALLEQKAVTQQEFDVANARARVAEAAMTEAETMLGYARVTAPFDGVVSGKQADVGDLATPGRPLLDLEDPVALRLESDVPEALFDRIRPGEKMAVRIAASTKEVEGVVSEIAPTADPNSRTFRVKLDLSSGSDLRPGQFGRVAVPLTEVTTVRVPAAAVMVRGQMEMVFVVADHKAEMRLVKTGKRFGDEIEVVSGLNAGEQIVAEGAAALLDGQPVEVGR